ncbi:MAG: cation diffusion facilitator family transporter [Gammaproteobacteria bacterium]
MTHSHDHDHHDHSHDHSHGMGGHQHAPPQSFNLAFAIAVLMNLAFTIFQASYAVLAGSMSLLADAAHNFGDVFGLMLAWGANWLLTLSARKRYSYGFKRTTIIAALANALILVATSALITYESIRKLLHVTDLNAHIVIVVAVIGIFINGGTAMLFMKGAHDDLNIKGAFLHLMGDALISIGVVVAAVLILYTHMMWIDPLVGLMIVAIILIGTWGLLRDSVNLILDAIPRHIDHQGIENYLLTLPGVAAVHDLHIWGLSTKEVALTAHLIMPSKQLSDEDYKTVNAVLKQKYRVDHATIQVETGSSEFPCHQIEPC